MRERDGAAAKQGKGGANKAAKGSRPERNEKCGRSGTAKKEATSSHFKEHTNGRVWWLIFMTIVAFTLWTRYYKIEEPDHVCWDETHFGKMGSWYINRTFFFDVHPPLGKMLIGLFGHLTGYDGTFPFDKPGDKYNGTKYIGMRMGCTAMGACIVPFAYVIVWQLSSSVLASTMAASFILFDVGILTLTQYILLDPILLFFILGSVTCVVTFDSHHEQPFSMAWWTWLILTGVMLAGAVSVKFVGLFVFLYVGLHTIKSLWDVLGDLSQPITYTLKHFAARAICLILLPVVLYISFFYVHLFILNRSGNGDGFYSSAFQSLLKGNSLHNASMPRELAYGAVVTLKNQRTGGGYLHSHWHLYPEGVGARQQQVTTYTHKDDNNKWIVKRYDDSGSVSNSDKDVTLVKSGDLVRLEHMVTHRNLHSHRQNAPVSRKHHQVTGYGENGTGDANDVWKVEVVAGPGEGGVGWVTTVSSRLRLTHYLQNCVLTSSGKQLPKWAYEQQEVSCNPNHRDKNAFWNIEDNIFAQLPNVSFEVYAPGFWERFVESHQVMFQGNSGLKPKEGEVTSRPWQWPINYRGQHFSGSNYRIYLLGNPVLWWANLVLLVVFVGIYTIHALRVQRGHFDLEPVRGYNERMLRAGGWLFLGWLLHYAPFWTMGRVLYFHHYFPALLFSSMLSGVVLDYIITSVTQMAPDYLSDTLYHWAIGAIFSVVMYSFYLFSPLAYGMSGPPATDLNSTMYGLKWMDSWEF